MKQDIEIAREATLKPISVIAATMGINQDLIEPYGKFIAKVPGKLIDEERVEKSNLILVTAITPTKAGIGKTTITRSVFRTKGWSCRRRLRTGVAHG